MSIIAAFMVPHPPMIVPDIGRGSEKQIEKTVKAYEMIAGEIAHLKPETIVISSPHSVMYADYFHISPGNCAKGSFSDFGAPQVKFDVNYDEEFVNKLVDKSGEKNFPAGTLGERESELDHGVMVPLWFILKKYKNFKLVRIGLSGLDLLKHYQLGMMIKETSESLNRKTVFVASGDLSHKLQFHGPYGFAAEGPLYDSRIMDVCANARFGELFDFDDAFCQKASECGHRSFVMMAGSLDGKNVEAKQYSHEDITGVGYGICSFYPKDNNEERCFLKARLENIEKDIDEKIKKSDMYVRLAREVVEYYVKNKIALPLPEWTSGELLKNRAGVFVSVHKFGNLRGCIGTIEPVRENIANEIIKNAISAVSEDPRFSAVTEDELKYLDINVDVLGKAEKIKTEAELDVKKYGVIVESGYKRGLLLPDLEGVDTVEQQIEIAKRKAGIYTGEKVQLYRFEVVRHY